MYGLMKVFGWSARISFIWVIIGSVVQFSLTSNILALQLCQLSNLLAGGICGASFVLWGTLRLSLPAQLDPDVQRDTAKAIHAKGDQDLVDYIDQTISGAPMVSNNPWLVANWHPKSDKDKIAWISQRRSDFSNSLKAASNAADIVVAMQQADKDFSRRAA